MAQDAGWWFCMLNVLGCLRIWPTHHKPSPALPEMGHRLYKRSHLEVYSILFLSHDLSLSISWDHDPQLMMDVSYFFRHGGSQEGRWLSPPKFARNAAAGKRLGLVPATRGAPGPCWHGAGAKSSPATLGGA